MKPGLKDLYSKFSWLFPGNCTFYYQKYQLSTSGKIIIDIFEELSNLLNQRFKPILLSSTKKELQGLIESTSKFGKQAIFAFDFTKKCHFVQVEKNSNESYDDVIVRVSSESKTPVATNDRELRKRLRKNGVPVIFLRQKSYLDIEGSV